MRPWLRYLGVVFLALLLFFALVRGAHASDESEACVQAMTPFAAEVQRRNAAGVAPDMNAYLIRSEPKLLGQGRWVLLTLLDVFVANPATPVGPALDALCKLHDIPTARGVYRSEFDKTEDI